MESDKSVVHLNEHYGRLESDNDLIQSIDFIIIFLSYSLNLIIAIIGIYSIPRLVQKCIDYSRDDTNLLTTKDVTEFFWATVFVCACINIACSTVQYSLKSSDTDHSYILILYLFPLYCLIFLIEVVSLWIAVKDWKIVESICCCSNRYVIRFIHTLSICHILWFLHRVGCNLLIFTIFIALAPAQTLAAISLIYSVIFCTIIYVTYILHHLRNLRRINCCKVVCKLLTTFMLFVLVIMFLIFLTFFFSNLASNGLTSSGLGSIVLSLIAPTIVFVITLKLK